MPLFSTPDQAAFSVAMTGVAFVILAILMTSTPMITRGVSADLAKVSHPRPMPAADREDALIVAIMRDGKVFFGSGQTNPDELSARIHDALQGTSQRVIYFRVDGRARYGEINEALSAARDAGIHSVGFLFDQRKPIPSFEEKPATP